MTEEKIGEIIREELNKKDENEDKIFKRIIQFLFIFFFIF